MVLVCESHDIKNAMRLCPHCGTKYTDCYEMEDGWDAWQYHQYICPGCGYTVEQVFKCEFVNVWKAEE